MFRLCLWIQSAFVVSPCYCLIPIMCFLSDRLFRTSSLPHDPHSLFNFPVYIYRSLYTWSLSERWSFTLCRLCVSQFIWDSSRHLFGFGLLSFPSPFVFQPFCFMVFDFCFVFDYNSCLLLGTSDSLLFGSGLQLVFWLFHLMFWFYKSLPDWLPIPAWINNVLCICPGLHLAPLSDVTWELVFLSTNYLNCSFLTAL